MPTPAIKRQRTKPTSVDCSAMIRVASEYQTRAKVKIVRRPKKSDSGLSNTVPMNMPAKVAAIRLAKPWTSKKPCVVDAIIPALKESGRDIGDQPVVVDLEK